MRAQVQATATKKIFGEFDLEIDCGDDAKESEERRFFNSRVLGDVINWEGDRGFRRVKTHDTSKLFSDFLVCCIYSFALL